MKPAFFTYEAEIKHILLRELVSGKTKIFLLLRNARRRTSKDFAPAQSSSQKNKRYCSCASSSQNFKRFCSCPKLVAEIQDLLFWAQLVAEKQDLLLLRGARRRKTKDFAPARSSSQKIKIFCSCAKLVAEIQDLLLLRAARHRKTKDFAPAQSSLQKNKGTLLRSFVFCYDIHNCRIIKEIFFSNGEFRKYTTIKREKCFACYSFSTKFR
ncbi:hypothetical protein [Psychrobacillus sp. FJAT-21963]|uniref:hypothetical protein n=1 Tax=Psychrobacillus sp. FJAT-21963 TaxID=1712028 RepID=UPI000700514B|nr:hypothetical protein [Psychrobacillus sp. FJAT-21963]KQL35734.1 hypothetical protein AN959_07495 [Psychrobacillus sp. FJAT-21963]